MIPENTLSVRTCQARWFECGDFLRLNPEGVFVGTKAIRGDHTMQKVHVKTTENQELVFNYHDVLTFQSRSR